MCTLLLAAAAALAGPLMIPAVAHDPVGRAAPAFRAPLREGGTFDLAEQHGDGRALVLTFWASWCAPCREELPALARLQELRDDVRVVAVNVDRERSRAEAFLRQVTVALPIVWDHEARGVAGFDVVTMPATFLVDDRGTILLHTTGFDPEQGLRELEAALDGSCTP